MTHEENEWKTVPESYTFSEGEIFQQVYEIGIPSWVPGDDREDLIQTLLDWGTTLETELNNQIPGNNELAVRNTELEKEGPDTYLYIVTYEVIGVDDSEPLTGASLWAVVKLLLAALAIFGLYLAIRETRILVSSPEGAAVGIGVLIVAGLYLWNQNKNSSGSAG